MNSLVVPSAPNWYRESILSCAPDNTLIYGSKCDILIFHPTPTDIPIKIEYFFKAHNSKVSSVDINPEWAAPNKWCISSGEDGEVKLWDIEKHCYISSHNAHKEQKDKLVGAKFLTLDRVLSVSENGTMFIWHPSTEELTKVANIFTFKVAISCFSPCPHAPHLTAFGLKNGLVIIANLKKNGGIVHKLRGHTKEIVSLSWCPAPYNVFPSKPINYIKGTSPPEMIKKEPLKIEEISTENDKTEDEIPEKNEGNENETITPNDDSVINDSPEKIPKENGNEEEIVTESPSSHTDDSVKNDSSVGETDELEKLNGSPDDGSENIKKTPEESHTVCFSMSVEEEPREEFLLASSARDLSIYIWRAGTDGRMQCFFRIPEKKFNKKQKKDKTEYVWTCVKWITPFTFISNTSRGDVLKYTLPKPLIANREYKIIHKDHSNFIFSIAAQTHIFNLENWLDKIDINFWTFGYDMLLLNTNLKTGEHLVRFEVLSNLVLCMAPSPVDPNRIALGLSNGVIKIWNTSENRLKSFHTVTYSAKILCKIVYLTWHPVNELMLAFCTEEGTIGFFNITVQNKATWFKHYFSNKVHKIQWGPSINDENKMVLYASDGTELVYFDPEKPKEDAVKMFLPEKLKVYSFSWKSDYTVILIQDANGKLVFLNNKFETFATFYQRKKVSLITWHPDSDQNMKRNHWVAATIEKVAYIFNFDNLKNDVSNIDNVTIATLEGHQGYIRSLAWTPFQNNYLVTAGDDGLALVWNVLTQEIISTYHDESCDPIKYIIWSPLNEDILIASKSTASLILWNKLDYGTPLNQDILTKIKQQMKMNEIKGSEHKDETESKKKNKKSTKTTLLPSLNVGNSSEEITKILEGLLKSTENNCEETLNEFSKIKQFFGSKEDILKLLTETEISHKNNRKFEESYLVSFWKGTLNETIIEAMDSHRVTPLLISLAPTVSTGLWQKTCESYAKQLEEKEDSEPLEIATYYLACQNIEKAIECLCERDMYKEALVLAKSRLPEDNVFVEKILNEWATYAVSCGALETAAHCYIVLKKYEEAVKVLFRRETPEILEFALSLAKKCNNEELVKAVEFRCQAFSNTNGSNHVNGEENGKIEKEKTKIDDTVEDDEEFTENVDE